VVDEEKQGLVLMAQDGYLVDQKVKTLSLNGKGLTVAAYQSGQPIYVPDVTKDQRFFRGAKETLCELDIPLKVGDRVIGVLNLESPKINAFSDQDQRVFSSYAERAALAIQNALLFESVEQNGRQIALLGEMTASGLATSNLDELLLDILTKLRQLFHAGGGVSAEGCAVAIFLWDEYMRQVILFAAQSTLNDCIVELGETNLSETLLTIGQAQVFQLPVSSVSSQFNTETSPGLLLGLPLIAENQKLGVVWMEFQSSHRLSPRDIDLGEQAARQIALAIARIKTLEMAHRHAQEAENLRQANAALVSSLDLREVLNSILDHLEQVISFDRACVFMVQGNHLHVEADKGFNIQVAGFDFPADDSLLMQSALRGGPIIIDDVKYDSRYKQWGGTSDIHGWMGVPLIAKGEIIGFLTVDSRQFGAFDEQTAALAQVFANQAAIAIHNARLYNAEQQRGRELEALHTAATTLVSTLEIGVLIERIISAITIAIPGAMKGLLLMVDEAPSFLKVKASFGFNKPLVDEVLNTDSRFIADVVQLRQPLLFNRVQSGADLGLDRLAEEINDTQSVMIAPLEIEEKMMGVILLGSTFQGAFSQADLRLLTNFANTVAAAVHNAQLHSEVQELAITDPLTNLYNRRGFFELGQRELDHARRTGYALSVIMMDADLLKNINDTYGHDIGDQMLLVIADKCRSNLRKTDITCRYGGDEFAILLPESPLSSTIEVAERLRQSVAEVKLQTRRGNVSPSVTIGVANMDEDCKELEALLKRADTALYQAKAVGRNRVRIWQGESSSA
jgi:diguanylate cyclase (GGDEF)-like protein